MDIYVGNLPYDLEESELSDVFGNYGTVDSVKIIKDFETGRSKGFAFVVMPNEEEGNAAIEALSGADLAGRPMKVNAARPKEDRPPRREGGGGYRGGREGGGGGYRGGREGGGGGGYRGGREGGGGYRGGREGGGGGYRGGREGGGGDFRKSGDEGGFSGGDDGGFKKRSFRGGGGGGGRDRRSF